MNFCKIQVDFLLFPNIKFLNYVYLIQDVIKKLLSHYYNFYKKASIQKPLYP